MVLTINTNVSRNNLNRYLADGSASRSPFTSFYIVLAADETGSVLKEDWSVSSDYGNGSARSFSVDAFNFDNDGFIISGGYDNETGNIVIADEPCVITYTKYLDFKKLRIDTFDLGTQSLISEETLDAGYDLVYYEIPSSIWGNTFSSDMLREPYYTRMRLFGTYYGPD